MVRDTIVRGTGLAAQDQICTASGIVRGINVRGRVYGWQVYMFLEVKDQGYKVNKGVGLVDINPQN